MRGGGEGGAAAVLGTTAAGLGTAGLVAGGGTAGAPVSVPPVVAVAAGG